MGMDGSRLSSNVVCRDDFPAVPNTKALGSLELEALVRLAMSLRSDYRAQEWVESAREAFLNGVKGKMAPQVDLRLKAAYAGYKDGAGPDPFFRSFGDNVPGASVSVQIQALWPFSNSTMRGILTQAKSQLEQARWEKEKLTRQIRSDLMVAWSQLKNKIAVLEEARLAGEKYRTSLSSERKKYLLGMSTLVNVLTVENQLTRAQLNLVVAQTEVATALVALRYQTGTILFQEGEKTTVHADDLIRLPSTQMQAQNRPGGPPPPGKGPHAW
jgi:outer membrane protein TolC